MDTYSRYKAPQYSAMVSYCVDMEVEGLRTASVIKVVDANPPQAVMSRETYEEILRLPRLQEPDDVPYTLSKPGAYSDDHAWFSECLELPGLVPNSVCKTETFPKDDHCVFLLNSASSWDGPTRDPNGTPNFSPLAIDQLRKEYYERGRGTSLIHNPQSNARRRAHSQPTYRPDLTNIQHGSLSKELRDAAFDRLAERYRAKYNGRVPYEPNDHEILTEYYKVLHTRPHYMEATGAMSKNRLKDFRLYLRYQCYWVVSEARINRIVLSKVQLVTTGLIPDIDTTSAPRKGNYHSLVKKVMGIKQETSNAVCVTLHRDPNFKPFVEIAHTINYENPDTPNVQSKEVAYVELTHRNARIPKLSDDDAKTWDLDVYKISHRVFDVSDRIWKSTLRELFPQTSTQKDYFKYLYGSLRSGAKLFLIYFRHNEHPCTSNVFTHRKHMPELCDDLRIVMLNSPYIFMLICSSGVDSEVESIVEAWKELTGMIPNTGYRYAHVS